MPPPEKGRLFSELTYYYPEVIHASHQRRFWSHFIKGALRLLCFYGFLAEST